MKIVHVVDSMEVGGAETLVAQMCRLQRQQGHEPSIYAVAKLGALGEQLQKDGFFVQPHVGGHLADSARNFYRVFKQNRPDVVHAHNPTPTIYASTSARLAGVPSIISTRHSLVAPPHKKLVEFKYALAARSCDWVAGICDATTNNMRALKTVPDAKLARVYNGAIQLDRVPPAKCPRKTGFTLLFVGRLAAVKNHRLLLKAFRIALASMPDLSLWMVGDGPEREPLETLASELGMSRQVTFWGQQMEVAPFFSAADAFVMSSNSEGLPMSLIQGFSLQLPAIVTDVGGMAEAVRTARAGVAVPLNQPAEMAKAIIDLASNHSERRKYAANAQAAFNTHFQLQAMVDSYMTLYRNTAGAQRLNARQAVCVASSM